MATLGRKAEGQFVGLVEDFAETTAELGFCCPRAADSRRIFHLLRHICLFCW